MFFAFLEVRIILSGNVILHQLSHVSADISGPDHLTKRLPGSILLVYHSEDGISHGWLGGWQSIPRVPGTKSYKRLWWQSCSRSSGSEFRDHWLDACPREWWRCWSVFIRGLHKHRSSVSGSFPERHAFKGFPWIWTSFLYYRASLLPPSCLSLNFLFLLIDSGFSLIHFSSLRDLGLLIPGTLPRLGNHSPSKQLSFSFLKINFYKSLVYLLCCDSFRCTVK